VNTVHVSAEMFTLVGLIWTLGAPVAVYKVHARHIPFDGAVSSLVSYQPTLSCSGVTTPRNSTGERQRGFDEIRTMTWLDVSLKLTIITCHVRATCDTAWHGCTRVLAELMSCQMVRPRRAVRTHWAMQHWHAASMKLLMFAHMTRSFRLEWTLVTEEPIRHQTFILATLKSRSALIHRPSLYWGYVNQANTYIDTHSAVSVRMPRLKVMQSINKTCSSLQNFTLKIRNLFHHRKSQNNCRHQKQCCLAQCTANLFALSQTS